MFVTIVHAASFATIVSLVHELTEALSVRAHSVTRASRALSARADRAVRSLESRTAHALETLRVAHTVSAALIQTALVRSSGLDDATAKGRERQDENEASEGLHVGE